MPSSNEDIAEAVVLEIQTIYDPDLVRRAAFNVPVRWKRVSLTARTGVWTARVGIGPAPGLVAVLGVVH